MSSGKSNLDPQACAAHSRRAERSGLATPAEKAKAGRGSWRLRAASVLRSREAGIVLSLVAIAVVVLLTGPEARRSFLSAANVQNLSRQIALLSVFAVGETFVIVAGGIDLSVGSVIAFAGVLTAILMVNLGLPAAAAIPIVLTGGLGIGIVHALLIARVGLQPFVATLGTMCILRGVALLLTDSLPIPIVDEGFTFLGNGRPMGIPTPVFFLVGVAALGVLVMRGTVYGKYIYALGSNEEATRLSGINVTRVKILAYALCAALAALAGIIYAAYDRQGNPSAGSGYELNAIAAAVIGGCSLAGGEGSIIGTVLGASVLSLILNGLNLVIAKNASLWEGVIVGSVVVAAVAMNALRQRQT